MTTMRRMPQNVDTLDAVTPFMEQNGKTTVFGGNMEIDGNLTVNATIKQGSNPVLTSGNVKTLFGNKSIYGSGNIDLYMHRIKAIALDPNDDSYFLINIISSKNLSVNSLTDLKTILGNTFEYPVSGRFAGNDTAFVRMTQSTVYDTEESGLSLAGYDFQDYVTTV